MTKEKNKGIKGENITKKFIHKNKYKDKHIAIDKKRVKTNLYIYICIEGMQEK